MLEEIKARWAGIGPWRGDVNGDTGMLEVDIKPHGYCDLIQMGDMEQVDGMDLRNMEAIGHAPADVQFLLAEIARLHRAHS